MAWKPKEERNSYQRAYRLARGVKPRVRYEPKSCGVCGGPVRRSNTRYCSNDCYIADTAARQLERWLAGGYNLPNHGDGRVPEYVKRWWFATHGERCSRCGWAERRSIDGRIPLSCDHVDGDCTNNRRENVRLLCPNCHALTDTYGSLNKVSQRRRWTKPKRRLEPTGDPGAT